MSDAATSPAIRTVDGVELPAPGTWTVDASHSSVSFKVKHLGLARTRGRFTSFDGAVEIGEGPGREDGDHRARRGADQVELMA